MNTYFAGIKQYDPLITTIGNERVTYNCRESWVNADKSYTVRCKASALFSYTKSIGSEEKDIEIFKSVIEGTLGSERIAALKSQIEIGTNREFTLKKMDTEKGEFTYPAPGCGRQTYSLYQLVRDHEFVVEKRRWGGYAKPLITNASFRERTGNFDVREEVDKYDPACPCPREEHAGPFDVVLNGPTEVLQFPVGNLSLRLDSYSENDGSLTLMIGPHVLKAQPQGANAQPGADPFTRLYFISVRAISLPRLFWHLSGIVARDLDIMASAEGADATIRLNNQKEGFPMSHPIRSSSISKKSPMPYRGMPATPPRRDTPAPPQWPSYTGNSQFVGTSPSGTVTVYVDPTLGQPGLTNAQDLVNDADRVAAANDSIFGTTGGPVSVIVFALGGNTDGTGGADHMSCDYVNGGAIEVCASFGDSARVSALFEAELSECSMGGNLCGVSTGEALSRWCASVIGNNALSDFATGPQWYSDGMPDYVDQTDPTDQDADSTGNGMVFISWLMSQGYSLGTIAQTMVSFEEAGTLAQVYATLTGDSPSNAWPNFSAAVNGLNNGVTSDDPFGGATQPAQLAHLAPWTVEMAGKVFATILADIAAGKQPHQIVASVRAAMISAPKAKVSIGGPAVCSTRSHRLVAPGKPMQAHLHANGPAD